MLLEPMGREGQERLREAHALVVGCGALGSIIAELLVRAGVGHLTVIDRDIVEWTNLQRQVLFDESDARDGVPKAEAARRKLEAINSDVTIDALIDDFNHTTVGQHLGDDVDVIVDGLDNFETRYLLNDLAVSEGIGYVYGGAVATQGMTATFLPHVPRNRTHKTPWADEHATPCLRCVFESPPPPGSSPTCDTVGVLGPLVTLVGSLQASEAIKILLGAYDRINRRLLTLDPWYNDVRYLSIDNAWEDGKCPCCGQGTYEYLEGRTASVTTSLCGRDAVQIVPGTPASQDLDALARTLASLGDVTKTRFMVKAVIEEQGTSFEITVFPNGRAFIKGTSEPDVARSIYARYVGA